MIQLVTRFLARDKAAAEKFKELSMKMKATVPGEPGNISYDFYHAAEDPKLFFCIESWTSQDAVDMHIRRNEKAGVNAAAAPLLAEAPDTKTLHPLQ